MNDKFSDTPPANNLPEEKNATPLQDPQTAAVLPDISDTLKAPFLPHVNPDAISYEQAHAGVCVHIPGSALMSSGDELVFYWGMNSSTTPLLISAATANTTVRVLCITYNFIEYVQYGLVDVYYEIYRDQYLIGTSPVLMVNVNRHTPVTPRQSERKRSMTRKFSRKPAHNRF